MSAVIQDNNLEGGHYAEPYAGGASLALSLLFSNKVREIHINDYDRSHDRELCMSAGICT